MGEVTEMILEGMLCEICGAFLNDSDDKPYPHKCKQCEKKGMKR